MSPFRLLAACLLLAGLCPNTLAAQQPIPLTGAARHDSAQAALLLQAAQVHYDWSRWDSAFVSARQAEQMLHRHLPENDPRLAEAYCLIGLCSWRRNDRNDFENYFQRATALTLPAANRRGRAHVHFFAAIIHYLSRESEAAEADYREALLLYESLPGQPHTNVGRIYTNFGRLLSVRSSFDTAAIYYAKAIESFTNAVGSRHLLLSGPYNNRGLMLVDQGQYTAALHDFNECLSIREQWPTSDRLLIAETQNNLGLAYRQTGEISRANNCFLAAFDIFQQNGDTLKIAFALENLGMIYQLQHDHEHALQYDQQALALERSRPYPDSAELAITFFNIATVYRDMADYDRALMYYDTAIHYATPDHRNYGEILNGFGNCYEGQRQYHKAIRAYQEAFEAVTGKFDTLHPMAATLFYNFANVHLAQRHFPEALHHNRLAQRRLNYAGDLNFDPVLSMPLVCDALVQESRIRHDSAAQNNNLADLRRARNASEQALRAYQAFYKKLNYEEKATARAAAFSATETAISTNQRLRFRTDSVHYWTESFHHAERTKAFQLYEAMQAAKALNFADIPAADLEQEATLRDREIWLEHQKADALLYGIPRTNALILDLDRQLAEIKNQYSTLIKRFENQYPEYKTAKYDLRTLPVRTVQDSVLQPDQSLVEYFVGDSSIFIFLVQKKRYQVREVKKDFPLDEWVIKLTRHGIYNDPAQTQIGESASIRNYEQAARDLYLKLWAPIDSLLTRRVIVVPDGVLGYMPFEALFTKEKFPDDGFADYPYLLHRHVISYDYSATMLREMQEKKHKKQPTKSLLGMAPFALDAGKVLTERRDSVQMQRKGGMRGDSLEPLEHSREEVNFITKIWGGTPLYGTAATAQAFRATAGQHRLLLLSTHAKASDLVGDYAYLAFGLPGKEQEFEKFYLRDLYNMTLNADLVVLSACETGSGKQQRSEGIISLARAFVYAGAKSLVTTLWRVDDEAAKDIMIEFHNQLWQGKRKDEALWKAKSEYLKSRKGDASPRFWAGFIGIGDMRALK